MASCLRLRSGSRLESASPAWRGGAVAATFALGLIASLSTVALERALAAPAGKRQAESSAGNREPQRQPQAASQPPTPLLAIVSIGSQHIEVHGPGGSVARSRVSTGTSSNPTPTGVFAILQRNRYHESNIYSNAPMPFMQRLTWSGIALHQGHVPNYPASHGCIRLPGGFAQSMWGIGRIGMRVIVSPGDVRPVSFAHARLPVPQALSEKQTAGLLQLAASTDAAASAVPFPARPLDPFEAAQARVARAASDKAAAEKAVKPAHEHAARRAAEANQASEALKASTGILADAEEHLELETLAMVTVQTEASEQQVLARIRQAEAGVRAAREAHERLKVIERTTVDESFVAAAAARRAHEAAETAAGELAEARRGLEPVSVLVSRRTGQVYVRQGFAPLHEEPITIADADRPLGTHVYTAIAEATGAPGLAWLVVSVPTSGGEPPRRGRTDTGNAGRPSSAAEALDRFELPEAVRALISERLWPGASLIVTDFGLGETGKGTDFAILTK